MHVQKNKYQFHLEIFCILIFRVRKMYMLNRYVMNLPENNNLIQCFTLKSHAH